MLVVGYIETKINYESFDFKKFLFIATPIFLYSMINFLYTFIDSLMISPIGIIELGAVGQGGIIFSTLLIFFQGILVVFIPLFAKTNDRDKSSFFSTSIIFSVLLALFLIIMMPLFISVYKLMGQPVEIIILVERYLKIVCLGAIFSLPLNICVSYINYNEESKIIVYIVIIGNLVNAALNYIFIYGYLQDLFSSVTAIAVATVLSRVVTLLLAVVYIYKNHNIRFTFTIKISYIREFLRKGIFKGISYSNEWLSSLFLVLMVGTAGSIYIGANQIADVISSFLYMVPQATVTVVIIYVSKALENGDNDRVRKKLMVYCSVLYLVTFLIGVLLTPYAIKLFSIESHSSEYHIAFTFMMIHLSFYLIYCYQNYLVANLDAILDVKLPALASLITSYIIVLPLAFLIVYLNMSVYYIWIIDGIGNVILLIFFYLRWIKLRKSEKFGMV